MHARTKPNLGFEYSRMKFETKSPPNRKRACFRARKILEELVYDQCALEGNEFTFPEVKTLMEGVTVGGRRVEDAQQVLNQARAWKKTVEEAQYGKFEMTMAQEVWLHEDVGREEAPTWGRLRDGEVSIAGTLHRPPPAEEIEGRMKAAVEFLQEIESPHERGMAAFLTFALNQPFWDGNKRTGRLMMNGTLLQAGHDVVAVPARDRQKFNEAMIRFYDGRQGDEMMERLTEWSIDETLSMKDTKGEEA